MFCTSTVLVYLVLVAYSNFFHVRANGIKYVQVQPSAPEPVRGQRPAKQLTCRMTFQLRGRVE